MKEIWPVRSLSEMLGKKVRLELCDGRVLEGMAVSFEDFTEDEDGLDRELIGLRYPTHIESTYDADIVMAYEIA